MGVGNIWVDTAALSCVMLLTLLALFRQLVAFSKQHPEPQSWLLDMSVFAVPWLRQLRHLNDRTNKKEFCRRVVALLSLLQTGGISPYVLVEGLFKYVKERHRRAKRTARRASAANAAAASDPLMCVERLAVETQPNDLRLLTASQLQCSLARA
jgi:hypothetical protein